MKHKITELMKKWIAKQERIDDYEPHIMIEEIDESLDRSCMTVIPGAGRNPFHFHEWSEEYLSIIVGKSENFSLIPGCKLYWRICVPPKYERKHRRRVKKLIT